MKTLALVLVLSLQLSGLWPHLPAPTRDRLTQAAVSTRQETARPPLPPLDVTSLSQPVQTGTAPLVLSTTTSILAVDRATAQPLYSQDADKQRPIASITKVMTALVVLSRHDPDETVTIGQLPAYPVEAETLGLQTGESYRLADLLRAALVISANDAADALAIYDSGSITKFAAQMNHKLAEWDISGARFTNASGLQDDGNYATAAALARIATLALQNPFITDSVALQTITFTGSSGRTFTGSTTNKLLASGRYYGIKTGYTLASGQCFLGLAKINGHDVITVVLGSPDRFGETDTLYNWISSNYQWL